MISGGTFYVANVSSVAENVNRKVAWESAQCRGLHSNTACEERQSLASPLRKGKQGQKDRIDFQPSLLARVIKSAFKDPGVHLRSLVIKEPPFSFPCVLVG